MLKYCSNHKFLHCALVYTEETKRYLVQVDHPAALGDGALHPDGHLRPALGTFLHASGQGGEVLLN